MRKLGTLSASMIVGIAAAVCIAIGASVVVFSPSDNGMTHPVQASRCVVPHGSGPGFDASITNQPNGGSYCIVIGERLLVILSAKSPDASPWRNIVVSKPGILEAAPLTLMFSRGVTGRNFRAVHVGSVVIRAQRPVCSPAAPGAPTCDAIELWRATIIVRSHSGPPPRSSGGGVFGAITAGPTCPVERIGHPCAPRAVSGVVEVRNASGATVRTTYTDAAGRYALSLSPGGYVLAVITGSLFPRCPDTKVTVVSGTLVRADIQCDTGMR